MIRALFGEMEMSTLTLRLHDDNCPHCDGPFMDLAAVVRRATGTGQTPLQRTQ